MALTADSRLRLDEVERRVCDIASEHLGICPMDGTTISGMAASGQAATDRLSRSRAVASGPAFATATQPRPHQKSNFRRMPNTSALATGASPGWSTCTSGVRWQPGAIRRL